mgnify:CR=1 FL=1
MLKIFRAAQRTRTKVRRAKRRIAPKMQLFAQLIALCALRSVSPPPILGSYFGIVPFKTRCASRSVRYERVPDRAFKVGCAKSYRMARCARVSLRSTEYDWRSEVPTRQVLTSSSTSAFLSLPTPYGQVGIMLATLVIAKSRAS